jgi:hypothetical protein
MRAVYAGAMLTTVASFLLKLQLAQANRYEVTIAELKKQQSP